MGRIRDVVTSRLLAVKPGDTLLFLTLSKQSNHNKSTICGSSVIMSQNSDTHHRVRDCCRDEFLLTDKGDAFTDIYSSCENAFWSNDVAGFKLKIRIERCCTRLVDWWCLGRDMQNCLELPGKKTICNLSNSTDETLQHLIIENHLKRQGVEEFSAANLG